MGARRPQKLDSDRPPELHDFLYSFSYKNATSGALVEGTTWEPPESSSDRSPELYDFLYSFSYKNATFGALVGGTTREPPESGF